MAHSHSQHVTAAAAFTGTRLVIIQNAAPSRSCTSACFLGGFFCTCCRIVVWTHINKTGHGKSSRSAAHFLASANSESSGLTHKHVLLHHHEVVARVRLDDLSSTYSICQPSERNGSCIFKCVSVTASTWLVLISPQIWMKVTEKTDLLWSSGLSSANNQNVSLGESTRLFSTADNLDSNKLNLCF